MENTLENKAKFFALYWGQTCYRNDIKNTGSYVEYHIDTHYLKEGYLLLTPLSQITDEDLTGVYPHGSKALFDYYGNGNMEFAIKRFLYHMKPSDFDILRSRGYALPYMGLSVEQLIEYGWAKLISE